MLSGTPRKGKFGCGLTERLLKKSSPHSNAIPNCGGASYLFSHCYLLHSKRSRWGWCLSPFATSLASQNPPITHIYLFFQGRVYPIDKARGHSMSKGKAEYHKKARLIRSRLPFTSVYVQQSLDNHQMLVSVES